MITLALLGVEVGVSGDDKGRGPERCPSGPKCDLVGIASVVALFFAIENGGSRGKNGELEGRTAVDIQDPMPRRGQTLNRFDRIGRLGWHSG